MRHYIPLLLFTAQIGLADTRPTELYTYASCGYTGEHIEAVAGGIKARHITLSKIDQSCSFCHSPASCTHVKGREKLDVKGFFCPPTSAGNCPESAQCNSTGSAILKEHYQKPKAPELKRDKKGVYSTVQSPAEPGRPPTRIRFYGCQYVSPQGENKVLQFSRSAVCGRNAGTGHYCVSEIKCDVTTENLEAKTKETAPFKIEFGHACKADASGKCPAAIDCFQNAKYVLPDYAEVWARVDDGSASQAVFPKSQSNGATAK